MTEPTACCAARCSSPAAYCGGCDLLVGLDGLHVLEVVAAEEHLRVRVESPPGPMGCPTCGVVVLSHGRREVELIDAPCFGRPVRVVWRKRTWWCPEPSCPVAVFTEQDDAIARPRGLLTVRASWWAVRQLRREHASVLGLARQLGTTWRTVWRSVRPLLEAMDADPARFDGVEILGVDEHIWHHVSGVAFRSGSSLSIERALTTIQRPVQPGRVPPTRLVGANRQAGFGPAGQPIGRVGRDDEEAGHLPPGPILLWSAEFPVGVNQRVMDVIGAGPELQVRRRVADRKA